MVTRSFVENWDQNIFIYRVKFGCKDEELSAEWLGRTWHRSTQSYNSNGRDGVFKPDSTAHVRGNVTNERSYETNSHDGYHERWVTVEVI